MENGYPWTFSDILVLYHGNYQDIALSLRIVQMIYDAGMNQIENSMALYNDFPPLTKFFNFFNQIFQKQYLFIIHRNSFSFKPRLSDFIGKRCAGILMQQGFQKTQTYLEGISRLFESP